MKVIVSEAGSKRGTFQVNDLVKHKQHGVGLVHSVGGDGCYIYCFFLGRGVPSGYSSLYKSVTPDEVTLLPPGTEVRLVQE